MKDVFCLNENDPLVLTWINKVGREETYRQAILNDGILPAWEDYAGKSLFTEARALLSNIVPADKYQYKQIGTILNSLPIGTQAAFWNNTFYFKDQINRGEVAEEAFHAIISTILTPSQRSEFYRIGELYLEAKGISTSSLINNNIITAPSIFNPLTDVQRKQRTIEEAIATEFREWYTKGLGTNKEYFTKKFGNVVGEFLYNLFNTIKDFFSFSDRSYINALFRDISDGKYKQANVVQFESATPATYLLTGTDLHGAAQQIGEAESEQVLRNLTVNFFITAQNSTDLTKEQILDEVMDTAKAYYTYYKSPIAGAFNKTIATVDEDLNDVDVDNPEYKILVEEVNKRIRDVAPYMFDYIEEDGGDEVTDENATDDGAANGFNFSDFNGANETGWDGISQWLKMYIKSVSVTTPITLPDSRTIEFAEAVDENRIYYGLARALNNSKNDFERLIKLIAFAEIPGNSAANALMNKLLKDSTGKRDVTEFINNLKNTYLNDYLITKDANIINEDIDSDRAFILQSVLKGFDMWSRTNMFQTVSPETGSSRTTNANVNNAVRSQIAKWQQDFVNIVEKNADDLVNMITIVENRGDVKSNVRQAAIDNRRILKQVAGIDVSLATLEWLLYNNIVSTGGVIDADKALEHEVFASEIRTYDVAENITSLLSNIQTYATRDLLNIFEGDEGIKGRLETLAKINALFDESVFESSYRNAEGKTIYGFQNKTFDLEFVANLQDTEFTDKLMNKGLVAYKTDDEGNDVYLSEALDFLQNNRILSKMYKKEGDVFTKDTTSTFAKILPYFKLESFDGLRQTSDVEEINRMRSELIRQRVLARKEKNKVLENQLTQQIVNLSTLTGRDGDGVTFSNILTKDFDLFRLNLAVNRIVKAGNETLYPHYIANLEAKRTADFVYLPEIKEELIADNTLNNTAIDLMKEEIRKEYDRIARVSTELNTILTSGLLVFNDKGIAKVDSILARQVLGKDVYEKYHTGNVIRSVDTEGNEILKFAGPRALEFSDSVKGILDKEYMSTTLANAAIEGRTLEEVWKADNLNEAIKSHWKNVIFRHHYRRLQENGVVALLDKRWKNSDGKLNRAKYDKYIVSTFLNTLSFNQMMHGDPALLFKNDGADFAKRKGGANAAIQSAETYLIAPTLGITKVKTRIKYVTANEMQSIVAYEPSEGIDQADAQNYATTEYKRYLLWSQGKLTKFLAKTLDDIEMGLPLTEKQKELMIKNSEFLNVDKTVAYNGAVYLKKSDMMLTKELTSILKPSAVAQLASTDPTNLEAIKAIRMDENNWEARPDFKFHHTLRQNMEGWRMGEDGLLTDKDKESKRYDLYMPVSASKMLNTNVFNPNNERGWNGIDDSIMFIDAKNYGLQLQNPAGKEKIIDPSQMLEIIFNEQQDNVEVIWKGEPVAIKSLEDLFQKYLVERDNSMFDIAYNEIFEADGTFDPSTFFEKALTSLISSGSDPQVIELFKLDKDGKPIYNPNMGLTKDKFTNLLYAHFTKGVLQQKVAGDAKAHVSSYGVKPLKQIKRLEVGSKGSGNYIYTWDVVKRDSDLYNEIALSKNYTELTLEQDYNSNNPGVIYDVTLSTDRLRSKLAEMYEADEFYFTDELRHIKPRYEYVEDETHVIKSTKPIAYYTESLMPATKLEDQTPTERNRWNFGVRIPSQDKHSAVNVEWVDTIPMYYGNTIITAKEIVTISGSDFDIDKLFLHTPEQYFIGGQPQLYGEGDKLTEYVYFFTKYNKKFADKIKALPKGKDWLSGFEAIRKELRLPEVESFDNPLEINNNLLALKQIALTNDGTLLDTHLYNEDGSVRKTIKATYKTAATMDVLKNLDKKDKFRKDGVSLFAMTDPLPNHIFDKHSVTHTKNSVGKQNINPFVNGNLGLILAIRAGFSVNKPHQIEIDEHKMVGFNFLSADEERAFDTLSSLISAATDEAKEQLNAKYNLNLEGAGIVKTMVSLGWTIDTSIAFVNQPIVQKFLKAKQDRVQTVYLTEEYEYKNDETLIAELVGSLDGAYEGKYGDVELTNRMKSTEDGMSNLQFDRRILRDLNTINKVTAQLGLLTRFLKVKKGFTGGNSQLDQLNEAVHELAIYAEPKSYETFEKEFPLNTHKLLSPAIAKNIPQVINVINNILPMMNRVTSSVLLDRQEPVRFLKNVIKNQLRKVSAKKLETIMKDVDTYIFTRLYLESTEMDTSLLTPNLYRRGESHSTVGQTFTDLKTEVNRIANKTGKLSADEERLMNLHGTSILKRLTVKTIEQQVNPETKQLEGGIDELRLNTFAKLSVDEQDTLITSFATMIKNLNYLSDDYIQFKDLPKQMFAYWIMRDGFQPKFGSVSKLFPVYMFQEHSNSINNALAGTSTVFNSLADQQVYDVYVKDILKNYAWNSLYNANFKSFFTLKNDDVPALHEQGNYTIDFEKLELERGDKKNQIKMLQNYPFSFNEKLKPMNIPLYTKASVVDQNGDRHWNTLELASIVKDGRIIDRTYPNFTSEVMTDSDLISKLEYKVMQTRVYSFQSPMLVDRRYTPAQQINIEAKRIVEQVSDIEENVVSLGEQVVDNQQVEDEFLTEQLFEVLTETPTTDEMTTKYELFPGKFANQQQVEAIDKMEEFLRNGDSSKFFVLEGKGGVGKTTIIKKVLEQFKNSGGISVVALSHKAKDVAKRAIGNTQYTYSSLASFLGMGLDMDTGKFTPGFGNSLPPVQLARIIVVDEASMINEEALQLIMNEKQSRAKVIFMGDRGQLPPIRDEKSDPENFNKISPVFTEETSDNRYAVLTERMRQGEESPILPYADYYWNNSVKATTAAIMPVPDSARKNIVNEKGALVFIRPRDILSSSIDKYVEQLATGNPNLIKTVVYKNDTRRLLNQAIRTQLFVNPDRFMKGDILMFQDGYGDFENSQEIVVNSVRESKAYVEGTEIGFYNVSTIIFNEQEQKNEEKFVKILKDEDTVKFNAIVKSLFDKAAAMPKGRERTGAYAKAYEVKSYFANIDYAYAITSHKSQGSTYDEVVVHEDDILSVTKITPKAKSQSLYTAITRAKNKVTIVSSKNPQQIEEQVKGCDSSLS